jgi:hypothetical protein
MATTQVDAVLKVEGVDGTSRPLSTDDLATTRTGAATETTLMAVLAELGGKLEAADIAALATAANQATAKNVLDAISQAIGAPGTNTLLSLLAAATPVNIPGASGAITSTTGVLMGVSARETSGTATAFFRLRAGGVAGVILATVTLAASESIRDWYGPSGIAAAGGVYFELVSGAVAGGVQTR